LIPQKGVDWVDSSARFKIGYASSWQLPDINGVVGIPAAPNQIYFKATDNVFGVGFPARIIR